MISVEVVGDIVQKYLALESPFHTTTIRGRCNASHSPELFRVMTTRYAVWYQQGIFCAARTSKLKCLIL